MQGTRLADWAGEGEAVGARRRRPCLRLRCSDRGEGNSYVRLQRRRSADSGETPRDACADARTSAAAASPAMMRWPASSAACVALSAKDAGGGQHPIGQEKSWVVRGTFGRCPGGRDAGGACQRTGWFQQRTGRWWSARAPCSGGRIRLKQTENETGKSALLLLARSECAQRHALAPAAALIRAPQLQTVTVLRSSSARLVAGDTEAVVKSARHTGHGALRHRAGRKVRLVRRKMQSKASRLAALCATPRLCASSSRDGNSLSLPRARGTQRRRQVLPSAVPRL